MLNALYLDIGYMMNACEYYIIEKSIDLLVKIDNSTERWSKSIDLLVKVDNSVERWSKSIDLLVKVSNSIERWL